MRHGEAAFDRDDWHRPLTPKGERQAADNGELLLKKMQPDMLLVSPLLRAQQSAEFAFKHNGVEVAAHTCDLVTPESNVVEFLRWLEAQDIPGEVAVVSHMPFVAELSSYLISGKRASRGFSPAQIQYLRLDYWQAGCADLLWDSSE